MRILVVEDEYKIANSIRKGLEQESWAVDLAYKGNEGYDLAFTEDYEVIVLDLMLPGMSGEEICKKLREENIHTPILVLTAKGELQDKVGVLNMGADDYLTKPFAFEELLARIRALARRPQSVIRNFLQCEDLTLDSVSFEVKRNNKLVQLSNKEFALLEYLMRHQNQILTKGQIISHVWDYDANILPNTVEVYIGYLRNKIDRPFRKPFDYAQGKNPYLIHTVRGFGYKIGK